MLCVCIAANRPLYPFWSNSAKIKVSFDGDKKADRSFQMPVAFLNGWLTWER